MKVLNLEESNKIVTKFLKHFGIYDEKKVDKYYNSDIRKKYFELKKPDIKKAKGKDLDFGSKFFMNSISYVASQAFKTILKKAGKQVSVDNKAYRLYHGSLFNTLNLPKKTKDLEYKDILKKYDDYFEIKQESNIAFSLIIDSLAKITNEKIFAVSDFWQIDRCDLYRHVLSFNPKELIDRKRLSSPLDQNITYNQKVYLFTSDFSFLMIFGSNECGDIISSTNKNVEEFKNALKQKNYDNLAGLKIGDKIRINNNNYTITKIILSAPHQEIRYLVFKENKMALEITLYDLDFIKVSKILEHEVLGMSEIIKSIKV